MYSTGTIAITNGSTTVTGTGTAWVGALRQGWLLMIPGEGPLLVASVQSATSLTLARAYQGTTRSGQVYDAVPTQGELAPFVTQLQDLLGTVQATIDNAGEGKFPAGTVALPSLRGLADEDTGVQFAGANVLNLIAGGVIRAALSAAGLDATNLLRGGSQVFSRNNILATVAQTAGVPTGGVIEKGSNANGDYTRYADGTQICWKAEVLNVSVGAAAYSEVSWTFPAAFVGNPQVMPNARSFNDATGRQNAARYLSGVGGFSSGTTGVIGVWNNHGSALTARVDGLAIGRWF